MRLLVTVGLLLAWAMCPMTSPGRHSFTEQAACNGSGSLPIEVEEVAMIDGCSHTRAFFTITFPLMARGLIATGVFGFIQAGTSSSWPWC